MWLLKSFYSYYSLIGRISYFFYKRCYFKALLYIHINYQIMWLHTITLTMGTQSNSGGNIELPLFNQQGLKRFVYSTRWPQG